MFLLAYTCRDYKTREALSVVVCMYIVHNLCLNIGCLAFVRDSLLLILLPNVLGFKKVTLWYMLRLFKYFGKFFTGYENNSVYETNYVYAF